MKIENLSLAQRLADKLTDINDALDELKKTETYVKNFDGHGSPNNSSLYSIHISEYSDGSGFHIDLTGCLVGVEILKYTKQMLEARRSDIIREIESL